jgi:hypothetical protein
LWLVPERELADQLALEVDDADVLVGDQELELAVLVALPMPIL